MKRPEKSITLALALVSMFCAVGVPALAQNAKPDLNGIWQVLNTAAWNIQDHSGELGVPPGQGVVEGNEIPYQPAALARKQQNYANRGWSAGHPGHVEQRLDHSVGTAARA